MYKKLSIIIPASNEERTIDDVLKRICAVQLPFDITKELIVVDDKSTDATLSLIEDFISTNSDDDIHVIRHDINKGKGGSIQSAITHITGDLVIFQDADLECDPKDYSGLINKLIESSCNVVYGNRFSKQNILHKRSMHSLVNRVLSRMSNL